MSNGYGLSSMTVSKLRRSARLPTFGVHLEFPLLDGAAADHLDSQLVIARRAADRRGHDLRDVVMCCRPGDLDAGKLADELSRLFFTDSASALARGRAIGEICDIAEEYRPEAIRVKFALASDRALPRVLRRAVDPSAED